MISNPDLVRLSPPLATLLASWTTPFHFTYCTAPNCTVHLSTSTRSLASIDEATKREPPNSYSMPAISRSRMATVKGYRQCGPKNIVETLALSATGGMHGILVSLSRSTVEAVERSILLPQENCLIFHLRLSQPPHSFSLTRFRSSIAGQARWDIHNGDIIRVHQPHSITKLPEPAPLRHPSMHARLRISKTNECFLLVGGFQSDPACNKSSFQPIAHLFLVDRISFR